MQGYTGVVVMRGLRLPRRPKPRLPAGPCQTVLRWRMTPVKETMDAETQTEGILIKASTKDVGLGNRFGCVREIDWMVAADRSAH